MQAPPKLAITLTTINDGRFLERFRPLLLAGGERISMVIAGDRKTPPDCARRVERLTAEGFDVRYLGLDAQAEIAHSAGLAPDFVPFDSDNRRNLAVLEAWRRGADVFVSLDDDNWPLDPHEFISCYGQVGSVQRLPVVCGAGRWPNFCAMLDIRSGWTDEPVAVFARGHPHARRDGETIGLAIGPEEEATVLAHVGLWSGHPDVDAATRAALDPVSRGMPRPNILLAPGDARAPMSTQNVAVARALVPAWWYVRMGPMKSGRPLDRFGDMFQAYFASMVIEALSGRFAFGTPLVRHERNPHSLLRDLAAEASGMALLEDLLGYIETVPRGATAAEAYQAVAEGLADALPVGGGLLGDDARRWADETAEAMVAWTHACARLGTP
uniref:Putative Ata16 protein n=1 Tax=mine drainage metagenome TaxID=410659 RepID=E6QWM0_9ZZZZ